MAYVVPVQWTPGGPRLTGTWKIEPPERARWTSWVGLSASPGTTTVVTLVELLRRPSRRVQAPVFVPVFLNPHSQLAIRSVSRRTRAMSEASRRNR